MNEESKIGELEEVKDIEYKISINPEGLITLFGGGAALITRYNDIPDNVDSVSIKLTGSSDTVVNHDPTQEFWEQITYVTEQASEISALYQSLEVPNEYRYISDGHLPEANKTTPRFYTNCPEYEALLSFDVYSQLIDMFRDDVRNEEILNLVARAFLETDNSVPQFIIERLLVNE